MISLEVIIHVNNRTDFLERAVASVLAARANCDSMVSVSSNGNAESFSRAADICRRYEVGLRRSDAHGALSHLRGSAETAQGSHVALLHDDDYVGQNFLADIHDLISADEAGAVAYAVGCDYEVRGIRRRPSLRLSGSYLLSPLTLTLLYLAGRSGPAFPSIFYRHDFLRTAISGDAELGKYSDTQTVIKAAKQGLLMKSSGGFYYCIHGSNDSSELDVVSKRRLIRFLKKELVKSILNKQSYRNPSMNFAYMIGNLITVSDA